MRVRLLAYIDKMPLVHSIYIELHINRAEKGIPIHKAAYPSSPATNLAADTSSSIAGPARRAP